MRQRSDGPAATLRYVGPTAVLLRMRFLRWYVHWQTIKARKP